MESLLDDRANGMHYYPSLTPGPDTLIGQSIRRVFPSYENSSPLSLEFSINLIGIEGIPSAISNVDPPSVGKQWEKVIGRLDLLVRISQSLSEVCACHGDMGIV